MQEEFLDAFTINGFKVRTNNNNEFNSDTAEIAPLWHHFYHHLYPKMSNTAHIYGVYTNYTSDHTGDYDIIACTNEKILDDIPRLITRHLPAGNYLKFTKSGAMPQACIHLWQEIWGYFNSQNCPHVRVYTQDIEHYLGTSQVEIFISIQ